MLFYSESAMERTMKIGPTDIVAIQMRCCGLFYACKDCHLALADHPIAVWPQSESLKTEFGAKSMALDPKTHNLYLSTAEFAAPDASQPNRRRPKPGTFHFLIYAR